MKPIDKTETRKSGVEIVGRATVGLLPQSNVKAAAKGGWQAAGAVLAGLLTLLTMLWKEPAVAATVAAVVKEHPEWALYFAMANVIFAFAKNRLSHRDPESRLVIVGDPKAGSPADRKQ